MIFFFKLKRIVSQQTACPSMRRNSASQWHIIWQVKHFDLVGLPNQPENTTTKSPNTAVCFFIE